MQVAKLHVSVHGEVKRGCMCVTGRKMDVTCIRVGEERGDGVGERERERERERESNMC